VIGRPKKGKGKVMDANGEGSVMARKQATQDEGKNSIGFISDHAEISIVRHWVECTWDGAGPASQGFLEAHHVSEVNATLQGKKDECMEAASKIAKDLGVDVKETLMTGAKKGAGRGKGAKGRGRGRG